MAALPWGEHRERRGVFSARGALSHMMYQLEQGHGCPTTMTFAAVPALFLATLFTCWLALYAANSRQLQIKYGSGIKQRASDVSKGSNQSLRGQGTSFGDQQKYKSAMYSFICESAAKILIGEHRAGISHHHVYL